VGTGKTLRSLKLSSIFVISEFEMHFSESVYRNESWWKT